MFRTELKFGIFAIILAYLYYHLQNNGEVMIIKTSSGAIQGVTRFSRDGREFFQWAKIPYAQPPVGNLRFASPKPAKEWQEIRDGSRYGPKCAQLELLNGLYTGEEDCLHVNIFRPKIEKGLLPVMVYIHGGAFVSGSANDFAPDYFMDEDVILITLNYRLGILGFLSTADDVIRGNMGLKDQALALTWIKQNVQNFGGNPQNIVVFGESAGGASVHFLTLAEKTRESFQKIISMSGVINFWGYRSAYKMRETTVKFANYHSCPTGSSQEIANCMRKLSVTTLLDAFYSDIKDAYAFKPSGHGEILSPVIEVVNDTEAFITESPYKIMTQGRAHKIPWMTGYVAQEGIITTASFHREANSLALVEQNFTQKIQQAFALRILPQAQADEISSKLRAFYFKNENEMDETELINSYTNLFSGGFFSNSIHEAGRIQREFSPVYLYYYNRTGGPSFSHAMSDFGTNFFTKMEYALMLVRKNFNEYVRGIKPRDMGICHMDDLLMLFPMFDFLNVPHNPGNSDYKFSKDMTKLWCDFAKDEKSMKFRNIPFLPLRKEGKQNYLILAESPKMMDEPEEAVQKLWQSINYYQRYSQQVEAMHFK